MAARKDGSGYFLLQSTMKEWGGGVTWWCIWLRHRATSQKFTGSIPGGVIETFH